MLTSGKAAIDMAASSINVPRRDQEALGKLFSLSQDEAAALAVALRSTPASISVSNFTAEVAGHATLPSDLIGAIVPVLMTLYRLRKSHDWSIPEFTRLLMEAAQSTDRPELKLTEARLETVRATLSTLLDMDSPLGIVAKARSLYYEHEKVVHDFSLITDFRPVFGSDPTEGVKASIIIHTLNTSYHDRDDIKEVSVVVTDADLDRLEGLIHRARAKAGALKLLAESSSIRVLNEG